MGNPYQGNPPFTIRLPVAVHEEIKDMAKVYGALNPRAFVRELLLAVLSGDPRQVADFNSRLITRMGEQLVLDLTQKANQEAEKSAKKAKKPITKRKVSKHGKR